MPSGRRRSPPSATAGIVGRNGSAWPIIRRSAGRASISKLTSELTGLPGSPNTGTPSIVPNANGLAGLMAICIQCISAIRPSTALTTS